MQINLPPDAEKLLLQQATAAGYEDVALFVTEHVIALAEQPSTSDLAPLTEQQLQASLAACDQSIAEFHAGLGLSINEAEERTKSLLRQDRS